MTQERMAATAMLAAAGLFREGDDSAKARRSATRWQAAPQAQVCPEEAHLPKSSRRSIQEDPVDVCGSGVARIRVEWTVTVTLIFHLSAVESRSRAGLYLSIA
jgi:hypothetical protein